MNIFKDECPLCGKEIEGFTEKHVKFLMMQHRFGKHPDEVVVRER